jgi:cephalosporin-C deacetylase-like acetyl esterase
LFGSVAGLVQNVLQENCFAFSSAHAVNSTEFHVNDSVTPRHTHSFENVLQRNEMITLAIFNNIMELVEIVLSITVFRSGNVSGQIQGGAIAFDHSQISVFVQFDNPLAWK